MYKFVAVIFLASSGLLAVSAGYLGHFDEHQGEIETKKDYNFDYSVHDPHSDGYHSHQEASKDGVVRGYYALKEADGSLREVHYTADPVKGFEAIVTKNGVQVDPQPVQHGSQTSSHGSQFSNHGSQFSDHGSQFSDDGSQFTDHSSGDDFSDQEHYHF